MLLLQPDKESCRSEISHARVYGLDLSKGIARAEIFFVGLKKNRVRTDDGRTEPEDICALCDEPILEWSETSDGQEAIFCEGRCNAWMHRKW